MSEQDLIRTIQFQQNEINQLKGQLARIQGINFQQKYRKALREIHGIINANRQLKQELEKLKSFRANEAETMNQIQKEEFNRTHQKLLKEKNQVYSEKEAIQLENQKLRYSINILEETVTKLKNDKMVMARQREADERFSDQKSPQKNIHEKKIQGGARDKQTELRRTIENYEQHHATISRANRRLEEENNELQNRIFNLETDYKYKINEKDIQLKEAKSIARQEYQGQITNLRKQIAQCRLENSQLSMKVQFYAEESQNKHQSENLYEKQLLQTLRDLKVQMEPMSYQIAQLQQKNQFEKEQSLRDKTSLQLKVVEIQSELERYKENQKILEQKLVRENEKTRKFEDTEKTIRKLQEENRMLGGRVIVLESKEVALRNRNGDELEERVMEFQTRVEMLLADKDTIGNMKNVGIHQLIALKAYIMELDGRLKQVVNENQYAIKKYRSYKEKCSQLIRELKQHDIAINSLKGKVQGYDRLVVKLQGELERAITVNDNEMKDFNMKISQTSMTSIEIYKKKYDALVEKLSLQEKYSQQEIETIKLNYETKIVDLNLKLEELNQVKDTIGLYKSKNEELSNKLLEKENELIETRLTKINIPEIVHQPKNNSKEIIQKLNDNLSTKEAEILKLENQVKSIELEWKSKYTQIEQSTSSSLSKKNKMLEDKENTIIEIEAQLKMLRKSNADMEATIFNLRNRQSKGLEETVDLKKFQNVNSRISELQIEIESLKSKNEIQVGRVNKLIKSNQELTENNNNMQAEITRLKFEGKRIEKELKMELEEKQAELRRIKLKAKQNEEDPNFIVRSPEIDNYKINGLKMELEMMETQYQQTQADKNRYYNRTIELEREVSALAIQVDELNYSLERSKNNATNDAILLQSEKDQQIETLQYQLRNSSSKIRDLEEEVINKENELTKLKNQYGRERQRLAEENDFKENEMNRISRELSKLKFELNSQEDAQSGFKNELQYKLNRLSHENSSLRDEIENLTNETSRLESEVRFLKGREQESNNSLAGQEEYIIKLSNDIKNYQSKEANLEEEINLKEESILKLRQQVNYYKVQLENATETLNSKDSYVNKLNIDINGFRNKEIEWEMELENKESAKNRLQSELNITKNQISGLEEEIQNLQRELNKLKYSHTMNAEQTLGHQATLEQKEMIISRLQGDLRIKSDHINELSEQIDNKNIKIAELQSESVRYRSMSTDFQSEMIEKNSQISRLNFELNSLKAKYTDLQSETEMKDNNWHSLNRELTTLKSQIDNFESEMEMKEANLERFRREGKELGIEIERLNDEVFSKNTQINQLNQQIFKLKMEGEDKLNEQIGSLENEIFRLKNKVSNLQGDLEYKEEEVIRTKSEISKIKSTFTMNRYTDEEYDSLQNQYYQLQKSSNETKRRLEENYEEEIRNLMKKQDSDKNTIQNLQFYKEGFSSLEEITTKFSSSIERFLQIEHKFSHRGVFDQTSYFSEIDEISDRKDKITRNLTYLEQTIKENLGNNRRGTEELLVQINLLKEKLQEAEARASQNFDSEKQLQEKDWGLHLYTNQVDRLRTIQQELKDEVQSLKLKLSQYQNQEDRIVENLTIMTLTFAEVDALRERMVSKEHEIKEVRRSLVNFAGSIQEINRRSSLTPTNTQTSIDNHPPTHGVIANTEQNAQKVSTYYRETDGSTHRGTTSYNYEFQLKYPENQNKYQGSVEPSAEGSNYFGHNVQTFQNMSAKVEQRRLKSEEEEIPKEQTQIQGQHENNENVEENVEEIDVEKKESMIDGLQMQFNARSEEKGDIEQIQRQNSYMQRQIQHQVAGSSQIMNFQQSHQGIAINQHQIQPQFYPQSQPYPQIQYQNQQVFVHGIPAPHQVIHQQPIVISQRGTQPRVNFGGSAHSSFDQSRNTSSVHSSFNQTQYGQSNVRNPYPAYPMMNMSR